MKPDEFLGISPDQQAATTVPLVKLSIRSLDLGDPEWNRLTLQGDGHTAFHCPALIRAVATAHGRPLISHAAYDGSTMIGGIVVGEEPTSQPRPLPMVSINGPLIRPSASLHRSSRDRHSSRVIAALLQSIDGRRGAIVRMLPSTGDIREVHSGGWQVTPTFSYEMDLCELKQAWNAMDSDRRRLVRRAERLGYSIIEHRHFDEDCAHIVDDLLRLHIAQQKIYGPVTPPSRAVMSHIVNDLLNSGCGRLFIARDRDGSAVAVQLVVVWGNRAANLFTGSSPSDADRGANTLLRWKAASHLHDEGVMKLDLNGARPGSAGRFKASLGAELVPRWLLHRPDSRPKALLRRAAQRARHELKGALLRQGTRA